MKSACLITMHVYVCLNYKTDKQNKQSQCAHIMISRIYFLKEGGGWGQATTAADQLTATVNSLECSYIDNKDA